MSNKWCFRVEMLLLFCRVMWSGPFSTPPLHKDEVDTLQRKDLSTMQGRASVLELSRNVLHEGHTPHGGLCQCSQHSYHPNGLSSCCGSRTSCRETWQSNALWSAYSSCFTILAPSCCGDVEVSSSWSLLLLQQADFLQKMSVVNLHVELLCLCSHRQLFWLYKSETFTKWMRSWWS